MAELNFDKTLADIPLNGVFVAKNGFAGVMMGKILPDYGPKVFACRNLATGFVWEVPADVSVCEVKLEHGVTDLAFAAGHVLGQLKQMGLIENEGKRVV